MVTIILIVLLILREIFTSFAWERLRFYVSAHSTVFGSSGNWTWIDTRGHRRGRMPCWSGLWIIGVAMGDSDTKVERSPIISCRPTPLLNSKIQCGLERTSASAAVLRTAQRSCQCISSGRTTVLFHSRSRCGVRPFTHRAGDLIPVQYR